MSKKRIKVVPDTSIVIEEKLIDVVRKLLKEGEVVVLIPNAIIAELEAQANKGLEKGKRGLNHIIELRKFAEKKNVEIDYVGERPSLDEIKLASSGAIDAKIRRIAKEYNAKLLTCDYIQALVAKAEGIDCVYFERDISKEKMRILKYLKEGVMSLHLKQGVVPLAKVGRPGKVKLVELDSKPLSDTELREMIEEIIDVARKEGQIEIRREGAIVAQIDDLRIAIAEPPFSDGLEVTLVRPIAKVTLDDYRLSPELKELLANKAKGILIAGPPGAGKTTFCQSLAEFLEAKGNIVKTMETPRDLQVSERITQYTKLEGDMRKTADILLLVRPDYTIYDELRKTEDFLIFADMRLAGVGMIGVTHATKPIDAIQRLIGRVELGMIPQIVDTIIFIEAGEIKKVYQLNLTVKVPHGMKDEDLARPVIEVRDFESKEVEYEIYSYGEEVVVMPVKAEETPLKKIAAKSIKDIIRKQFPNIKVNVEIVSDKKAIIYVASKHIPKIIGKQGRTIESLERKIGMSIEVRPLTEKEQVEIPFMITETDKHVIFEFGKEFAGREVSIYADDKYIFGGIISKSGTIKIDKKSKLAKKIRKKITKLKAYIE